jgi:hypothetical protein
MTKLQKAILNMNALGKLKLVSMEKLFLSVLNHFLAESCLNKLEPWTKEDCNQTSQSKSN